MKRLATYHLLVALLAMPACKPKGPTPDQTFSCDAKDYIPAREQHELRKAVLTRVMQGQGSVPGERGAVTLLHCAAKAKPTMRAALLEALAYFGNLNQPRIDELLSYTTAENPAVLAATLVALGSLFDDLCEVLNESANVCLAPPLSDDDSELLGKVLVSTRGLHRHENVEVRLAYLEMASAFLDHPDNLHYAKLLAALATLAFDKDKGVADSTRQYLRRRYNESAPDRKVLRKLLTTHRQHPWVKDLDDTI